MAQFPKKPSKGDRVLQSLYNTVCDIVDYLPSLNVVGDNKTTYVNHSAGGTTIHAIQPSFSTSNKSNEYIAGSGIVFTSGNIINAKLSAGPNINIDYNSGWLVISGTPAGSGGGGGGSGYTYTGDGDLGSGHIFVDYSYTDPVICSNLRYIDDLLNYPISGDSIGSELHFVQIRNIKDGAGTKIDYHWSSTGNHDAEDGQLIKWIDGVCVNLNVSGGTYITTKFHQGVGYGDYTSASIDCNLSGTYDQYPHTSGFIAIVPQYDLNQNITGGIISTNLHAGSGIAIDPQTGEISCTGGGNVPTPVANTVLSATSNGTMQWTANTGGGGGGGGGMPWPNYANLDNSTGNTIMNYTRYQAGANGGWLRISYKGQMTDDCYYVKIGPDGNNDPTIGLWRVQNGYGYSGQIGNTWLLPVPPNNYIYVSFPNSVATAWFDSSLSPDSPQPIPPAAHGYPDDINRNFDNVRDLMNQAEGYYQDCIGYSDYSDANEYAEYAESSAESADDYATDSETKNAVLVQYGITDYTTKVTDTRTNATTAQGYATQARQYADSLPH